MGYKKGEDMNTNTGGANITAQRDRLYLYLQEHESVSRSSALSRLGIANLPEIVRQLRVRGIPIKGEQVKKVNRYGQRIKYTKYSLEAHQSEI